MSSNPFGTNPGGQPAAGSPFNQPAVAPAGVNGAAVVQGMPSDAVQEIIDLDSPLLTSEQLVNTEGDAYAAPAPPPDAKYRVKLKLEGLKHDGSPAALKLWPGKSQGEIIPYLPKVHRNKAGLEDQVYLYTTISASIIDPSGKFDGINLYDSWVGTFLNRNGSTKVQTILSNLGKAPSGQPWIPQGKVNQQGWMDIFVKALSGEPEVGVETVWEWSCEGCGQVAKLTGQPYPKSIQGMQKFPVDQAKSKLGSPVYVPELKCQVNPAHAYSRARATIARFVPLSDLGK